MMNDSVVFMGRLECKGRKTLAYEWERRTSWSGDRDERCFCWKVSVLKMSWLSVVLLISKTANTSIDKSSRERERERER